MSLRPINSQCLMQYSSGNGAVAIEMLMPETADTFQEYIDAVLRPFINKQLQSANRVDITWDVYKQDSLKSTTIAQRRWDK